MWQILIVLFGISLCIFAGVMVREPRTLWSGVAFFWMMVCLAIAMFLVLARYLDWLNSHSVLRYLLIGLMFLAMFSILAMPAVLILMFFVEGLKVIRHEGMKPANLLSMAFSVLLFGYLTVWPFIGGLGRNILGTKLYVFSARKTRRSASLCRCCPAGPSRSFPPGAMSGQSRNPGQPPLADRFTRTSQKACAVRRGWPAGESLLKPEKNSR